MAGDAEVDKESLYGEYLDSSRQKRKLFMKGAHKALDIAEDDMQLHANKSGIGALGAMGIAAASGLPAAAVAALLLWQQLNEKTQPPPAPPVVVSQPKDKDTDTWNDFDISSGPRK